MRSCFNKSAENSNRSTSVLLYCKFRGTQFPSLFMREHKLLFLKTIFCTVHIQNYEADGLFNVIENSTLRRHFSFYFCSLYRS